jgi:hypothetical protein
MLIQSRASRISDVLTSRDVDEIADSPPGAVQDVVSRKINDDIKQIADAAPNTSGAPADSGEPKVRYAMVRHGKAEFGKTS